MKQNNLYRRRDDTRYTYHEKKAKITESHQLVDKAMVYMQVALAGTTQKATEQEVKYIDQIQNDLKIQRQDAEESLLIRGQTKIEIFPQYTRF